MSEPRVGKEELEEAAGGAHQPFDPIEQLDSPTAGGKVIRGSFFRIGGYGAGVLLGVLSASLMIRHLGVVDWGRYVTVTSLVAIVAGLSEAGLSSIGAREYVTREGPDRERLMRNLLGLRLVVTTVGVLVALVFAAIAGYTSEQVLGTLLAGIALLFAVQQQMYMIPLGSALKIGWVSGLDPAARRSPCLPWRPSWPVARGCCRSSRCRFPSASSCSSSRSSSSVA